MMLLSQKRGRAEHRHLSIRAHRLERGAYRHLGLAVSHVTKDQAVHRPRLLHVGFDIADRGQLVGSFLVGERCLELALPRGIAGKRISLGPSPRAMQAHDLLCHRGDRLANAIFRLIPIPAAHPRDPRHLTAGVFADRGQLVDRHIEAVLPGIGNDEIVTLDPGHRAGDQALKPADPVARMNDEVARSQIGIVDPGFCAPPAAGAMRPSSASNLLLAEDRHPLRWGNKAAMDAGGNDGHRHSLVAQHLTNAIGRWLSIHGDDHFHLLALQAIDSKSH